MADKDDAETLEISEEELRKLSPEARIARLKAKEEASRKQLEETRKKVEEEIAAAEVLIEETVEEVEEEDRTAKESSAKGRRGEKDDLEERVTQEKISEEHLKSVREYKTGAEYQTRPGGSELYGILETAAETLERLYGKTEWDAREARLYQQAKEHVDHVREYNLTSDKLREEFGTAESILKRLQYRH